MDIVTNLIFNDDTNARGVSIVTEDDANSEIILCNVFKLACLV